MSKKILVVEDSQTQLSIIKDGLETAGYSVVTAGDGEEALEKYRSEGPDLIILDIMLPKLDGYGVAKRIRSEEPPERRLPIIMLTARTAQKDGEAGFASGTDVYLKKPFDPDKLLKLVKKYLEQNK
ncbi:MAG: response regulator [Candidatus Margulisiibacteriota bacterium]